MEEAIPIVDTYTGKIKPKIYSRVYSTGKKRPYAKDVQLFEETEFLKECTGIVNEIGARSLCNSITQRTF